MQKRKTKLIRETTLSTLLCSSRSYLHNPSKAYYVISNDIIVWLSLAMHINFLNQYLHPEDLPFQIASSCLLLERVSLVFCLSMARYLTSCRSAAPINFRRPETERRGKLVRLFPMRYSSLS